jgi:hypothetical protein
MSSKKYCQKCGTPTERLAAKLCDECGNPFTYGTQAATPPPVPAPQATARPQRPPQRLTRRQQIELDAQDAEGDDDDDNTGADDSYVPEINALECDIQINETRQTIGNIAGTSRSEGFQRPPDKVPKSKKAFENDFLKDWQREAGTSRKKK